MSSHGTAGGILTVILLTAMSVMAANAEDQTKRDAVIEALEKNGVGTSGLRFDASQGGPAINLGTGPNGSPTSSVNDDNLTLIAQLPELERVMLFRGTFSKAGLGQLANLPNLKMLSIYEAQVDSEAFAALAAFNTPYRLSLGEYPITDKVLGYIGANRHLKGLEITKQQNLSTAAVAQFLKSVDDLETLWLVGDTIDDVGLARLGAMKNIHRLGLESQAVTAAGWRHLAGLTKMRFIVLRGTKFDDQGMRALEGMKDLEVLILRQTGITDAGLPSLANLSKLQDLGIDATKVTDAGMTNLRNLTELKNLYVSQTAVTAKGLAMVPRKDRMVMMSAGKENLSSRQVAELAELFPGTQIFDPSGYWKPERIQAAMKELGKN